MVRRKLGNYKLKSFNNKNFQLTLSRFKQMISVLPRPTVRIKGSQLIGSELRMEMPMWHTVKPTLLVIKKSMLHLLMASPSIKMANP